MTTSAPVEELDAPACPPRRRSRLRTALLRGHRRRPARPRRGGRGGPRARAGRRRRRRPRSTPASPGTCRATTSGRADGRPGGHAQHRPGDPVAGLRHRAHPAEPGRAACRAGCRCGACRRPTRTRRWPGWAAMPACGHGRHADMSDIAAAGCAHAGHGHRGRARPPGVAAGHRVRRRVPAADDPPPRGRPADGAVRARRTPSRSRCGSWRGRSRRRRRPRCRRCCSCSPPAAGRRCPRPDTRPGAASGGW